MQMRERLGETNKNMLQTRVARSLEHTLNLNARVLTPEIKRLARLGGCGSGRHIMVVKLRGMRSNGNFESSMSCFVGLPIHE